MSVVQAMLDNIKYKPVTFVESRLVAALAATTLNNYSAFEQIEPHLVWLRSIAFTRNANVNPLITGTVAAKRYEDIIAFGTSVPNLADSFPINVPFDFDGRVQIFNVGVAIANYAGRVTWQSQDYRVADKLSLGISYDNLDVDEKALADKFHIKRRILGGTLPMAYPKGDLQWEFIGSYAGNPVAGNVGETNIINRSVPDGYKLVLTKVWANHPAANFGNLEIRVYQDRTLVLTLFPISFPNWGTAVAPPARWMPFVDLWIPAMSNMRVTVFSGTGHAGIVAGAEVEMRRLTIWDKMAWGYERVRSITPQEEADMIVELDLWDKLDAGIYELVFPQPAVS